jgi:glutamate-5-semialdehyde dehydrogenase
VTDLDATIADHARRAREAARSIVHADDKVLDEAISGMAARIVDAAPTILAASTRDVEAAEASGMSPALIDRLRLDAARLEAIGGQLRQLAEVPHRAAEREVRTLDDGSKVLEREIPIGVVGANYEARPNVTIDVASQLVKSRNAGVLRTGAAALGSAAALVDEVVAPALADAGLDPQLIQLVRQPDRDAAFALVHQPELIPLVILRGSGDSTRSLANEAARHGVRTLAHADGGASMYVHPAADRDTLLGLVGAGLDRLGVCNRLNLLLLDEAEWDSLLPVIVEKLESLGVTPSLPPHTHRLGHEWALDDGKEATVTISPVAGPTAAARTATEETSGLAATIVTDDAAAAREFIDAYGGTGVFWNRTTRVLDGFKLLGVPETGINVDRVPGPRGPVTFRDLVLRQFVVVPG